MKKNSRFRPGTSGAALLVLVAGCGLLSMGDGMAMPGHAGFGSQSSRGVLADSALAMFLIGLAVGVPAGIGLFFAYLVAREKHETGEARELDAMLESLADAKESEPSPWDDNAPGPLDREPSEERRDPWEKPADWWRGSGDGA